MTIATTIIPVFIVIFTGLFARRKGFLSPEFLNQANRLVYYFAIPAMIFSSVMDINLKDQMNSTVVFVSLAVLAVMAFMAWITAWWMQVPSRSRGSYIQCCFHGNLGYIGFAIVFYSLGEKGLATAAIISSFVMILHTFLAVVVLQYYSKGVASVGFFETIKKTVGNPVILSAAAGIAFSLLPWEMPLAISRALAIIKGMALPMALLIIGASLSFEQFKSRINCIALIAVNKLIVMPAVAFFCFRLFSISRADYLPGLIILAAPTATMTYVLAKEIGGDPDLAVTAISFSTLLSAVTYTFWLGLV